MRNQGWVYVACLLFLAGGCQFAREEGNPEVIRDSEGNIVKLIAQVRERLPSLEPGMTEAQVQKVLSDLPLGEEIVASRTISGGKTVQYALSLRYRLELTFIPRNLNEAPPGGLREARLIDLYP